MKANATRNALSYYLNTILTALLGIIVNPILLNGLGATNFGVWKATSRFLDFASVADGRATQALKWTIAFKADSDDETGKRRDVGAAILVWLLVLPVIVAASIAVVLLLPSLIADLPPEDIEVARTIGAILAANIVLMGLLSIPDAVLVGSNVGYRSMNVTTLFLVLSNVAMISVAWSGAPVQWLAVVVVVSGVLNGAVTFVVARRDIPWLGVERPRRTEVRSMGKFSGGILLWELAQKLLVSSEMILLSVAIGSFAVAQYTFTSYVVQFYLVLSLVTTSAVAPQLGAHIGAGDIGSAAGIARIARSLSLTLAVFFGGMTLLLNSSFIALWAGREMYLGNGVNALLVLSAIQVALIRNESQMQDAGLRVWRKLAVAGTATVAALVGAVFAYSLWESVETSLCVMIAIRIFANVILPHQVNRLVRGARYPVVRCLTSAVFLLVCYEVGSRVHLGSWLTLFLFGALAACVVGGAAVLIALPNDLQRALVSRVRRALTRGHRGGM
ncbi:hypothetical protein ITJ43_04830 [Microbacterium sp. VKM Ac-2870]|uniref:lipopolysaccharide biosynthesis protein n=1 Tax=Microbacterium sp. VKM Ac-2870 TaxID=2783825 RepID=UPI00188C8ADF|nr:hypothetical protein [Microbacterium sp. VKM Ac-2870]MBF4561455.1 hypothetical protein [Microbacterium sp. VKM Ac-2870]